MLRITNFWR